MSKRSIPAFGLVRDAVAGNFTDGQAPTGRRSPLRVGQYGRVHGVAGLHVVDTSTLPDYPRANTNVITMMLGERIADRIEQGL